MYAKQEQHRGRSRRGDKIIMDDKRESSDGKRGDWGGMAAEVLWRCGGPSPPTTAVCWVRVVHGDHKDNQSIMGAGFSHIT